MSSIYGIFSNQSGKVRDALVHLERWNHLPEIDTFKYELSGSITLGITQEHLTDQYPAGNPVIHHGQYHAVIDAILYNRKEIHELLLHQGENLQYPLPDSLPLISDEEMLMSYILEFGPQALHRVNGDFAGVVYDSAHDSWMLFRDHMGVRPLYYYADDETLIFSTDIRGIAANAALHVGIHEETLFKLTMGYNLHSLCDTFFDKIHCVKPASWMNIKPPFKTFETYSYWELGKNKIRLKSKKDYEKRLLELVSDAVNRRLDVISGIIGAESSGGFDSSVVAALIGEAGRDAVFFSWSLSPAEKPMKEGEDERKAIEDICERYHLPCYYHGVESDSMRWKYEQEINNIWPPEINTIFLLEGSLFLKTKGARVMFTGHGGDEGISHRSNPYELWLHHEYLSFIRYFCQKKKGTSLRLLRVLKGIWQQITVVQPQMKTPYVSCQNADKFIQNDFYTRMRERISADPLYFAYDPVRYIKNGGSRPRMDNAAFQGSAAGVRYMFPFLDYRVIDFAVSIPRHLYLDGYRNRKIYRDAFRELIPKCLENKAYKDTPSNRRSTPPTREETIALKNRRRDELLQTARLLDPELWKPYLKLDELCHLDFSDEFTWEENQMTYHLRGMLETCYLIQNLLVH